ncbi:MAG: hypothetical protein A2600_01895 [Candidatus Lambdaproteobacteria bacterium RIFOXYD1_FULL_56_27]|uniref:Uncharacterized protein n=1 Tax=Candidatus Lambdaproteobacteria bacterium RIFOXYD2_FULL_56_26 TaxID=1817773 RepID=A0A1F6GMY5_9PROT|nr:MAG: hypothetical protein A2557_12535 [Candidatus Lambdaproteobacteria bacterium RIFOXYD2_FULL_56_26]OGH05657.1 MAG: hypothetical protein A2426_04685 [Candidatus Lambdaproteobacteria bacterium RIFOXYC1_FULL_56_13]OGH08622.1 MAG: hypothetical protein A2600_01895 [Candidatus Lambdaproteobacteria bacterium RIFOXYD1_FULL_56_27]
MGRPLCAGKVQVLQVNLGLLCNLSCQHCHVQAGPKREEMMSRSTLDQLVHLAQSRPPGLVDLTGGAPELHPLLQQFILALAPIPVQVRTNLTALLLPQAQGMAEFFAAHKVGLVASLPCYTEANVERQRGKGAFGDSIEALRLLNRLGYGVEENLSLQLIYNPGGPSLPPAQTKLEADYKTRLAQDFGVSFTKLACMTNMPIGKFQKRLVQDGKDLEYFQLLTHSYNQATLPQVMCRHQLHVSWDGTLHDCDFNYALGLTAQGPLTNLSQLSSLAELDLRPITTGNHCFGCTAGSGSSCGGALTG